MITGLGFKDTGLQALASKTTGLGLEHAVLEPIPVLYLFKLLNVK